MGKTKKRYIIEKRTNPNDKWNDYKKFSSLEKAKQSFQMCVKHVSNIFKDSNYDKFRLIDSETDSVLDDSSNDSHIFFE